MKGILLSNDNWKRFLAQFKNKIRYAIIYTINKLLTCRNVVRGYHQYNCSTPNCTFIKKFPTHANQKPALLVEKSIEIWIQKQSNILPNTAWQHITFTMPQQLWSFFWFNRSLLNHIGKIAADCIKAIAELKNAIAGAFITIHTFKRNL